ncbi:MAG TPA: ABC-F family ATP-binding cassette domain-containing protein [Anaerolineales bacterium]|nr:ABC-F family ATP-binding cassette domain-containing protein [Anaerolineales bacterium]
MISISLSSASLILGARTIFQNLTWEIQHDQRIGLVGANGAGKSSLLKMIVGEYTPEFGGGVTKAKGVTVGYLPQDPVLEAATALETVLGGEPRIAQLEAELARVEARLADPDVYNNPKALERALDSQHKLLHEYSHLGGDTYESRAKETLRGLGLPEADWGKPEHALSGGQKKLVGLARLLMAKPSVLLLDEPDNHLDLAGKAFLEGLIRDYPGAVVIISHDRYLLDAIVTHIAEIEDGKIFTFTGDYTAYILDKEERLARQEELYQIQQRKFKRIEAAIRRYAVWAVLSEKFASRLRASRALLERAQSNAIDKPITDRRRMDLALNGWRGSNKVLELINIRKTFEAGHSSTSPLRGSAQGAPLRRIDLLLRHGERAGLIGANGAGKSVLLKIIINQLRPDAGEVKIGPSVKLGYYAQEHETLDFNQTLIDAVRRAHPFSEQAAVAFLKRYLFPYQQTTLKIGSLSGGERSRLQLALLVLSGVNFLLLDEPTNNLDIASAEVLENALDEFEGTVLVISHDRYFLDRTVNRIVELESGVLTEYAGGYSDYAEKKSPHP